MHAPAADELDPLLANVAWVRSLARRLARDAHVGDDVSQQALAASLERPPVGDGASRRWLATVALNFLRQRARADARRAEHEARASRRDELPSTLELVARASAQQAVVAAVLRLEEPYRTTVLLRFFESLPPRVIAKRQGVPVATVRTRLARALERLRAELLRAHGGDRTAWLAALAPLLAPPSIPWAVSAGALAVNIKLVVAVGALAACAALWFVSASASTERPERPIASPETARIAAAAAPAIVDAGSLARAPEEIARPTSVPAAATSASKPSAGALDLRRVRGRVIDVASNPVADVEVVFRGGNLPDSSRRPSAVTGSDGRFVMEAPWTSGEIDVVSPHWLTVLAGVPPFPAIASEPVIVVAPRLSIGGNVVDENGAAIESTSVALALPADFRAAFREVLDFSIDRAWTVATDARGRFDLADAPALPGALLTVSRAGFTPHAEPAPRASVSDLSIVLRREIVATGSLAGRVIDATGRPVPGAAVSAGGAVVVTADDGRFQLAMLGARTATVRAAKAGFLPALAAVNAEDRAPSAWPASLELRLGDRPLSIRGQVIDADGEPVPAAIVALVNATWFGRADGQAGILESVIAGAGSEPVVDADAEGRFHIDGLLVRDYRLRALDRRTLRAVETDGVRAGRDDVRVQIPAGGLFERVAGRVVDRRGAPIARAAVRLVRNAFVIDEPGGSHHRVNASLPPVKTDADGRFEVRNVARDGVILNVSSPSIVTATLFPPLPEHVDDLTIVASRRCHLKVELADAGDRADRFVVLDPSGEPLEIAIFAGEMDWGDMTAKLSAGRSEVVSVEETARTLVLLAGKEELRRVTLELKPGEVTVVRP